MSLKADTIKFIKLIDSHFQYRAAHHQTYHSHSPVIFQNLCRRSGVHSPTCTLPLRSGFIPRAIFVAFVVGEMSMGHDLIRLLRSTSVSFHHYSIFIIVVIAIFIFLNNKFKNRKSFFPAPCVPTKYLPLMISRIKILVLVSKKIMYLRLFPFSCYRF